MRRLLALLALGCALPALAQPYEARAEVRAFIDELVARHGFAERELKTLFSRVQRIEPALVSIRPGERPPWTDYRALFVNETRIAGGLAFWNANRARLAQAEREYGVPAQYIVAIIGIETLYGRNMGRWRVVDALTTLAFDYPPRAEFFRSELEQYLLLARETGLDVFDVRGSYAGAIGIPQFMPGSLRRYAVDYDADGAIDLRRSNADAIGSVANFLKQHGWQPGTPVQLRAKAPTETARARADGSVEPRTPIAELAAAGVEFDAAGVGPDALGVLVALGDEHRVALRNFYVITRYNRSAFYAGAVCDLAETLASRVQSAGR